MEVAGQKAQEEQRRWVRPVQIVEHQDERRATARGTHQSGDRVEEPEARLLDLEHRSRRLLAETCDDFGHDLRDVRGPRPEVAAERFGVGHLGVASDDAQPGMKRRRAGAFPAAPPEHDRPPGAGDRGELVCEPCLADAGLAGEKEQAALARDGGGQTLAEQVELDVTSDEGACGSARGG